MDQYRDKVIAFQKAAEKAGCFYVFDTETTGIPKKDPVVDIIEFSAIKVGVSSSGLKIEDSLDLYINPGYLVPKVITDLTGITQEKIDAEGVTQMDAQRMIHEFWGDSPLLCGYNSVSFDEPLVDDLYKKTIGASFWSAAHLDVLRMAKEKVPANRKKNRKANEVANHKLATMAEFFGVDEGLHFHEAIEDVKATLLVMKRLMPMYKEPEKTKEAPLTMDGFYITYINHWKKSFTMDRIYVKNSLEAKIYYDLNKRMWYIGNRLPEDEVLSLVFKKAGVRDEDAFIEKYKNA